MKMKDLKDIEFYFDTEKNILKGILAIYHVNPLLQRGGKLGLQNGSQNMSIIGECSVDERTIREKI